MSSVRSGGFFSGLEGGRKVMEAQLKARIVAGRKQALRRGDEIHELRVAFEIEIGPARVGLRDERQREAVWLAGGEAGSGPDGAGASRGGEGSDGAAASAASEASAGVSAVAASRGSARWGEAAGAGAAGR